VYGVFMELAWLLDADRFLSSSSLTCRERVRARAREREREKMIIIVYWYLLSNHYTLVSAARERAREREDIVIYRQSVKHIHEIVLCRHRGCARQERAIYGSISCHQSKCYSP